jgi:hypothetical protein
MEKNNFHLKLIELENLLAEKSEKITETESKIEASQKRSDHLKNAYDLINVNLF